MPSRTSRSSAAPSRGASHPYSSAVAYHASQITILWIVFLSISFAGFLILLTQMSQLQAQHRVIVILNAKVQNLEMMAKGEMPMQTVPQGSTENPGPAGTLPVGSAMEKSPSGALVRGSVSPDGTRYAGYNDAVKSKRGMAVEILADGKVKYIDLFSPSQSSGAGTDQEAAMSVRWKDNQTIEYDVLVTKNGEQVKEVQTTQIYF